METWIRSVFPLTKTLLCAGVLSSVLLNGAFGQDNLPSQDLPSQEPVVKPQVKRAKFNEAKINVDDFQFGVYYGLLSIEDFGTNSVMVGRLTYHVSERFFLEGAYGLSQAGETSYEKLSGSAKLLTDEERDYTYYDLSVGYALLPGEAYFSRNRTYDNALYVLLGAGTTEFAGDEYFTLSYGAGYRLLFNDWIAFHAVFRDHMFDIDLLGESKTTHNFESTLGLSLFF